MNNKKLVSIVIPTFKGEDSLPIALMCLYRQSYANIEVIVSDDNEKGNEHQLATQKIAEQFSKKMKVLYLNGEHVNGSHARNEGLKIAQGDYIALLDDDDYYLPSHIEEAVQTMEENKDADLVFFDVAVLTKEKVSRSVHNESITDKDLLFYRKEIGTGSNIFIRRQLIDKEELFDESYLRSQDIEYIVKKLFTHKSIWVNKKTIVKYYNQTDNYLNYSRMLVMNEKLRNDVFTRGIISEEEKRELENKQLHNLYNDMLVKNMPKKDLKVVYEKLKEASLAGILDKIMFVIYNVSSGLFNFIFKLIMSLRKKKADNRNADDLYSYRNELLEGYRKEF